MSRPARQHRVSGGPHLALIPAGASAQEAAAIVAALEQFVRDTATPAPATPQEPDRWLQAALQDGCARDPGEISRDPWINT